jgi:hypothetical protein
VDVLDSSEVIATVVVGGKPGCISSIAAFTASAVAMMFSPRALDDAQRDHRVAVEPRVAVCSLKPKSTVATSRT